jgi:kynureninase
VLTPQELDRTDLLARFRAEFHLPQGIIYLDGNSLGLLSRRAEASLMQVLDEWRTLGIHGWTEASAPWLTLAEKAAAELAPYLGATADEVCITGQTTSNLHQLLATLFDSSTPGRAVILGDELNFASDLYALQSHLRLRGLDPATHLRLVPSADGRTLSHEAILSAFRPDVQIAVLPAVLFGSGQLLDLLALTKAAHARGIMIGFDCSHSIGSVPHEFDRADVDFAFWCNYKWLNAGPGSVGGIFLNRRHFGRAPGLAGWWGVRPERRFAMPRNHEPATGASALHVGTPHILSLSPLAGSLELIRESGGVSALRSKSIAQTRFLIELADRELARYSVTVASPRNDSERGGHVALAHNDAWQLAQALRAAGVVPDFRRPDLIRLAPSPLYTSFVEIADAVMRLKHILESGTYKSFSSAPALVP